MLKTFSLAGAVLLAASLPALANPVERPHTTVALVAESASVAPGKPLTLALHMTPQPKWHTYWKNPGDSGMETTVTWDLPEGFKASELEYPAPTRLPFGGELVNFGYEGASTLLVTLTPPADLTPGDSVPITAKAAWLVCDDQQCVPEDAELKLTLPVGDGAIDPANRDLFAKARAAMPTPVDWPVRFNTLDDRFTLEMPWELPETGIEQVLFYPIEDGLISYTATQDAMVMNGKLRLSTKAGYKPDADSLTGVITVKLTGAPVADAFFITGTRDEELPAILPPGKVITSGGLDGSTGGKTTTTGVEGGSASGIAGISLPLALGSALLGGLLLNLMPCVFPILSLKALSLARAGESERGARREALAYTGGVLVTMALLGGLLLALRAGGEAVGWAFHLQDPRMVALLALLMVAIGLNLAGVFEVTTRLAGAGQNLVSGGGAKGAFWTGALAVLVATPCTAPFMAAALGATLTLPPALGLAIYLALGLGMALPFLALGYVAPLRRLLPRPGAWMDTFRRVLAFPMFATALWLFWIVGRQVGLDAMVAGLAVALLMALALWLVGRSQETGRRMRPSWRWGWAAAALLIGVTGGLTVPSLGVPGLGVQDATAGSGTDTRLAPGELAAAPFSDATLDTLLAAGTPTFVYFTADWCVTCKLNERVALERPQVADAFKQAGVSVLVGDWTRRDDTIAAVLRRYGRDGVPLYLYFPEGATRDQPQVLPQILTPSLLIETVA